MQGKVPRHKTAIARAELSRPLRTAIADGLMSSEKSVFDYGCGLGDDVRLLEATGFDVAGWDPVHRPNTGLRKAKIVNLGYVINVIEKPLERQEVLRKAWDLAEDLLIVSARTTMDGRDIGIVNDFADGLLTRIGTFQKFFDQQELRNLIDHSLGMSSVPAAPGIFYVFRDEAARNAFVATRYQRRIAVPRVTRYAELFRTNEDLLGPLMGFMGVRGRLPADDEIPNSQAVRDVFGSLRKAFQVILTATEREKWEDVARQRTEDLLTFLALARFDGRRAFGKLPTAMQLDVKEFFRTYTRACAEADEVLLTLGSPGMIEIACRSAKVGKRLPEALYVHEGALGTLPTVLRLYEGCARGYVGRVEGANIVKLHSKTPKISYLSYPHFDRDPHPALAFSVTVHLQTFRVEVREYLGNKNPPILHRKESFLSDGHPLRAKFAKLTKSEEARGLYEDTSRIGTRLGWNEVLAEKGFTLRGHRLVRQVGTVKSQ